MPTLPPPAAPATIPTKSLRDCCALLGDYARDAEEILGRLETSYRDFELLVASMRREADR